jgi:hypothetical protein
VRPRPKIPLPAAALAVAAAAASAGLIASGALIIDRVGAYNADGIYLRAGHPVRALLGPDHYMRLGLGGAPAQCSFRRSRGLH